MIALLLSNPVPIAVVEYRGKALHRFMDEKDRARLEELEAKEASLSHHERKHRAKEQEVEVRETRLHQIDASLDAWLKAIS